MLSHGGDPAATGSRVRGTGTLFYLYTTLQSKILSRRPLGGSVVKRLPSAQSVILESRDLVPHPAPCGEPASPSACVSASLCMSLVKTN